MAQQICSNLSLKEFHERATSVFNIVCNLYKKQGLDLSPELEYDRNNILFTAVHYENSEALRILLQDITIDVNTLEKKTRLSLLHLAVQCGSLKCIDLILDANPDVNIVDSTGKTAAELKPNHKEGMAVVRRIEDHLVKLCAANIWICKNNSTAISEKGYAIDYILYSQEVDAMRNSIISPFSSCTFYSVLMTSERRLAEEIEFNEDIFESEEFCKFPSYGGMIKLKLKRVIAWKNNKYCKMMEF